MSLTAEEKLRRLERAIAFGGNTHTVAHVVQAVRESRAQWWDNGEGFIVTELEHYPLLRACRYWLIAGELKACLSLDEQISQWAISEGCRVATATGRKGWGRAGAPYGWKPHSQTFFKDLVT